MHAADALTVHDTRGRPVVALGLNLTLYFDQGHSPQKRAALARCCKRFLQQWPTPIRWIGFDGTDILRTPPDVGELVIQYLGDPDRSDPDAYWAFIAHAGATAPCASPHRMQALGQPAADAAEDESLSFACFSVDMAVLQSPDGLSQWMAFVLWCCEALDPVHGYCGPTLVTAADSGLAAAHANDVYALAQRYAGIDVDYPVDHAIWLGKSVKAPCWLTVLSTTLLEALGGVDAVRQHLGPTGAMYLFRHGAIIQASELPELGDRNRRQDTPGLRALASILEPIQLKAHGAVGDSFEGLFDAEAYTDWMHRFL